MALYFPTFFLNRNTQNITMTLSDRVTIRWKLFGGIGIIGSVLLLVMGYNLASLTEDNRLEEIDFQSRRDTGLMQKRYKSCEAQRKSMAESKGGKVDTIDFLNLDIKGSEEQIATAQRMIQLTSTLHTECEDKRSELTNQLETRTTVCSLKGCSSPWNAKGSISNIFMSPHEMEEIETKHFEHTRGSRDEPRCRATPSRCAFHHNLSHGFYRVMSVKFLFPSGHLF